MCFHLKRLILGAAVSSLILTFFQTSKSQTVQPTPSPSSIRLTVTVMSSKRFVTELNQENFQVWVDKDPAKIVGFTNQEVSVSLGVLVDASASMGTLGTRKQSGDLSLIQRALARFFELGNPANDYFLMGFNVKPQLLVDWTSYTASIVDNLGVVKPKGNTALFDACYLAIEKLQRGRHPKRVLLLISDGQDNISRFSFHEVKELLKETGILLYAIDLQSSEYSGTALDLEGEAILSELTTTSGGFSFRISRRQRNADEIFGTVANELRNQFSLEIESRTPTSKKKWHKIKVKLTSQPQGSAIKDLNLRTRAGYYSFSDSN
ncbi:MAG TPA: VWA domain-containing protein [Pyrinomonadaceae bacterium]|nr:VWA domain-containing protein [Pyrinomonadaceae bacterium]